MNFRALGLSICLAVGVSACTSSPITPTGSVTVTAPASISPSNGAEIANLQQPVTLSVTNAVTTDASVFVSYTFEVATDSGFANKVVTQDVPQGTNQTSLKLNALGAGTTYYWRVKATAGDSAGTFGGTLTFKIGPAIIVQAPVLASPLNGSTVTSAKPTLTVTNAVRSGPVGSISYLFEIATDANFTNKIATGTIAEGTNTTSFTPSTSLTQKATFFWHAKATESSNNITGGFSTTASFATPADPNSDLWPVIVPPGTNGKAIRGDNWEEQDLISAKGIPFHTPTLETRRIFDLMDKGFSPQGAIDWMHNNGYPTEAAYYANIEVIGVDYVYLAKVGGAWHIVIRSE